MNNKKDLEHELFFGLVFSLTLLIITYPEISELSDLFANFVDKTEAIYVSQLVKVFAIIFLILSSVCRYYGAVKNNIRYVMLSLFFFLLSFHISFNLILYKVFWIWLSDIHFIFTTALPILLLVINIFILNKYERKWFMYYGDKIPNLISSDFSIIFNLWALLSLDIGGLLSLFIPLTTIMIYMIIFTSALLSPAIVLSYRKKYPYTKESFIDLENILGIGPKRAKILREYGIADVKDFIIADHLKLKTILGINKETITRMKNNCKELLNQ